MHVLCFWTKILSVLRECRGPWQILFRPSVKAFERGGCRLKLDGPGVVESVQTDELFVSGVISAVYCCAVHCTSITITIIDIITITRLTIVFRALFFPMSRVLQFKMLKQVNLWCSKHSQHCAAIGWVVVDCKVMIGARSLPQEENIIRILNHILCRRPPF